ncbi:hypothetical protein IFR09_10735 [Pseudomonas syringae]|nr:hypothetical protein [Pseudomonas syringae]MBD8577255.1 hypothetical protein [Pseudomonas syringae]MBD8790853.1 hypothetical protein [Pseudomonas syringae]MBD8802011.1 hypothetical protein [Pseudomonas syringae]MBD8811639.1 hypothetical protein [Pseudomonas syringae]
MAHRERAEVERLEQRLADAYAAYRKHFDSAPYPASEQEWAELNRYRKAVSQASAALDTYCAGPDA